MLSRNAQLYDSFAAVIDSIAVDPDPAVRLSTLRRICKEGLRTAFAERNRSAYDLRLRMTREEASRATGIHPIVIDRWARKHMKPGMQRMMTMRKADLSMAVDMSEDARFPSQCPANED